MTLPWLIGAVTIASIWVGVWRLLLAIGLTAPDDQHSTSPDPAACRPASMTWQQPDFAAAHTPPDDPGPAELPTFLPDERDHR